MILEINKDKFEDVLKILKSRNRKLYLYFNELKEIECSDSNFKSLNKAREIKTKRVKEKIKNSIVELIKDDIKITKYQVSKKINVSPITISKYFNEILNEVNK